MLLSLIIPVYKVENYIEECIRSVIQQVTADVEIIIVNDDTPDHSMLIIDSILCEQTAEVRDCFVILHQQNQGQSSARNTALKVAKGKYICFLDSDDVLDEGYFNNLKNVIKNNDIDIIQFGSARFKDNINDFKKFDVALQKNGLFESNERLMIDIFNQSAWFPWLNIYKKELFNGLAFPVGIYYEDAALIPEVFLRSRNIYFLESILYFYRVNLNGSLLNSSFENKQKHLQSFEYVIALYASRLQNNKIYSPSFVSMCQSFVSFQAKYYGLKKAFNTHEKFLENKKYIDFNLVNKRGNKLYYKFGMIFIILLIGLGRI